MSKVEAITRIIEEKFSGFTHVQEIVLYAIEGLDDDESKKMFLDYVKKHPDISKREIYSAIYSIRYERGKVPSFVE